MIDSVLMMVGLMGLGAALGYGLWRGLREVAAAVRDFKLTVRLDGEIDTGTKDLALAHRYAARVAGGFVTRKPKPLEPPDPRMLPMTAWARHHGGGLSDAEQAHVAAHFAIAAGVTPGDPDDVERAKAELRVYGVPIPTHAPLDT